MVNEKKTAASAALQTLHGHLKKAFTNPGPRDRSVLHQLEMLQNYVQEYHGPGDPFIDIERVWRRFERESKAIDLIARFTLDREVEWQAMELFFLDVSLHKRKASEAITPEQFFFKLFREVEKSKIEGLERAMLLVCLKYLQLEASLQKMQRDLKMIRLAWTTIHPMLERFKLLQQFRGDEAVKSRLREFVRGGFG